MSDLQNALQKAETNFRLLALAENGCSRILLRNKIKEVRKHIAVMESRLDEISDLKSIVQEIRLEKDESVEDVEKWSTKLEKRMECYDSPKEQLQSRLKSLKKQDEDEIKEKKIRTGTQKDEI